MKKNALFRLVFLLTAMMCALGASADQAYACYTPTNMTLTFYYDTQRSSRSGTTYDLNTGSNIPGWYIDSAYASVTSVVFDPSFANARPYSTYCWFQMMTNLTSITGMKEYLNTSSVTNMLNMFNGCSGLTSLDVSGFNTAQVTSMSGMFRDCFGLTNLDLSGFNTDKVINMGGMFYGCSGLTSLDVSGFNTAKVTNMTYMFYNCSGLTTIYAGIGWSTDAVTYSDRMFYNCTSLVGGQGTAYDANHTDKTYAHIDSGPSNPGYFTEGYEAYACYTPMNTTLMFYYDTQRISRSGTTYDLNTVYPSWYTDGTYASVTSVVFDPSFANARPKTTEGWFHKMSNMKSITGMKEYLNTSAVTNMSLMFYGCSGLTSLDLSGFNTDKVEYMGSMFSGCSGLTNLDVSGFNTAQVKYMSGMFRDCSGLTSLDLSNFDTSSVTSMSSMFSGCRSLTNLDVSGFNTAQVTEMDFMFSGCSGLTTIYASSGWSTDAVASSDYMFTMCTSLVGGQGTTFNANHTDKAYARIDGGLSNPGYFTDKNDDQWSAGDVNGDKEISIADVNAVINMILTGNLEAAGDVDGDGEVTISDANYVINIILSN